MLLYLLLITYITYNAIYITRTRIFSEKPDIIITAPMCRKQHIREYYSENGCRSRRPVKLAKCWGSCGNSCCLPRKTKRRKVRRDIFMYRLSIRRRTGFAGSDVLILLWQSSIAWKYSFERFNAN